MTEESVVYMVDASFEDDRPVIAFDDPANEGIDWLRVDEVLRGERPAADYEEVHVEVAHPDATSWGFYSVPGTLDLISAVAVERIGRPTFRLFNLLPARLNDAEYYFLKPVEVLPCLDRARSEVIHFHDDPSQIEDITKYAFRKSIIPDPLLFSIPELFGLFATPAVCEAVARSGIPGFEFTPLG